MADLNDLQASGSTKIVGSDANGAETYPLAVDSSQQALVKDAGANAALASIDTKLDGPLAVTQSGEWTIDVTVPAPAGGATEAKQDTGNTSLASIDSKLVTTANGIKIDGSAVTQNTIATNNLITVAYNQIVVSAVNSANNPTTILYKQNGTTVATLTIAYDAQGAFQSVTRS
jgi:hypothetical protein